MYRITGKKKQEHSPLLGFDQVECGGFLPLETCSEEDLLTYPSKIADVLCKDSGLLKSIAATTGTKIQIHRTGEFVEFKIKGEWTNIVDARGAIHKTVYKKPAKQVRFDVQKSPSRVKQAKGLQIQQLPEGPKWHSCYVVSTNGIVRLLNQQVVDCYEYPLAPPIEGIVTRLDFSGVGVQELIKVKGLLVGGALYGCETSRKEESKSSNIKITEERKESDNSEFQTRIFICTVLLGRESAVKILNNRIVELLEEPKKPPIVGVVYRLDLSEFYIGDKIKVRGILNHDNIFGAELVEDDEAPEEKRVEDMRTEEWHSRSAVYTCLVKDRKVEIHGYHKTVPAEVFVEPELPPIMGFTIRFDLNKYEGYWVKFRAAYERNNLWGAILLDGDVPNPHTLPKQRVMDNDDSFKYIHGAEEITKTSGRVLLGLSGEQIEDSRCLFEYVLQRVIGMGDYLILFVTTKEDDSRSTVDLREKSIKEMISKADIQGVKCEVVRSFGEHKTDLITEADRVEATVIVIGNKADAEPSSIFHESVPTYCSVHTKARIRVALIPDKPELDMHFLEV